MDTAYEYAGMVAYGYEMSGRGAVSLWGQPFTFEDVRTQEIESWTGLEHAFLNVHRYGAHLEVRGLDATRDGVRVHVVNTGYGPLLQADLVWEGVAGRGVAAIGPLGAGNNTTVTVPVALADGVATLTVEYPKRLVATSNIASLALPVHVGGDVPGEGLHLELDGVAGRGAPAVGLIVVGMMAMAVRLRRR